MMYVDLQTIIARRALKLVIHLRGCELILMKISVNHITRRIRMRLERLLCTVVEMHTEIADTR